MPEARGNVVNLLNPELIVLGGGLVEAMESIIIPQAHASRIGSPLPSVSLGRRMREAMLKS